MKKLDIQNKADLLRQLAHPTRLIILMELAKGAKCVTDIRDLLDIPQPNVSQHLMVLRNNRVVDSYEDGQLRCYYLLRPALVKDLLSFICEEYPEVKRDPDDVRREGRLREKDRADTFTACEV